MENNHHGKQLVQTTYLPYPITYSSHSNRYWREKYKSSSLVMNNHNIAVLPQELRNKYVFKNKLRNKLVDKMTNYRGRFSFHDAHAQQLNSESGY